MWRSESRPPSKVLQASETGCKERSTDIGRRRPGANFDDVSGIQPAQNAHWHRRSNRIDNKEDRVKAGLSVVVPPAGLGAVPCAVGAAGAAGAAASAGVAGVGAAGGAGGG